MTAAVDVVVIGAGVVGLAIGRELALGGLEVLLLEQHRTFGSETSSRNSEVIHAGIYYPRGSLKARGCVEGRRLLYRYCDRRALPYRRCGKMIVATDPATESALAALGESASLNGVATEALSGARARRLEPDLRVAAALIVADSGIIDSHAFMRSLLAEAEGAGAILVCNTPVIRVARDGARQGVWIAGEAEPAVRARWVVNSAGLSAAKLAARMEGLPAPPTLRYAKGSYFAYAQRAPFDRLIYPVPEPGGLGIHLTLDLAGGARLGPDVEWTDSPSFEVDPRRKEAFAAAASRWWPALDPDKLVPGFAGIRPKLGGPGEPSSDFRIDSARTGADSGLVALYGIESPGLTASLWLGRHVFEIVTEGRRGERPGGLGGRRTARSPPRGRPPD
ncbi:MAG TPA: NAD(P)/FAD-dependent oxidoreductase [Allosphingosinicella sp.]|jgi:L-2-hydroxyglutarate oxidase LhgO|nr:NAD(P)/FAD-dependent oxidoreductase [Allosphingosinicella sp.]